MKCWLAIVERGDGQLQDVEIGAPTKEAAIMLLHENLPGVKLVKITLAIWTSA